MNRGDFLKIIKADGETLDLRSARGLLPFTKKGHGVYTRNQAALTVAADWLFQNGVSLAVAAEVCRAIQPGFEAAEKHLFALAADRRFNPGGENWLAAAVCFDGVWSGFVDTADRVSGQIADIKIGSDAPRFAVSFDPIQAALIVLARASREGIDLA